MKKPSKARPGDRGRPDERRQLLTYMREDLIRMLKGAAAEQGRPAYEVVEEAVEAYLKARKRSK
jgi:hypothetical protein